MTLFKRRTATLYSNHRKRAAKTRETPAYNLDELRKHLEPMLEQGCSYCGCELTEATFTADHIQPTSRNGRWELRNLCLCCAECNQSKSTLTGEEYRSLRAVMAQWHPWVRQKFLARLRAGARVIKS